MKIAIIGLGQMGGSLALAAKQAGHFVYGYNRNPDVSQRCLNHGIIDEIIGNLKEIGKVCLDIVVLATPLRTYEEILYVLDEFITEGTLITDIGSVKEYPMSLIKKMDRVKNCYIGGHPMGGTERSGIENMSEGLFEKKTWFYTVSPVECYGGEDRFNELRNRLLEFLRSIGARPHIIDPEKHDYYVGSASHLPQAVSVLMAASLKENHPDDGYLNAAGGGFRDVSRLAGSSQEIWKDIMFLNKENLLKELSDFSYTLNILMEVLEREDEERFKKLFREANFTRHAFIEKSEELGIEII